MVWAAVPTLKKWMPLMTGIPSAIVLIAAITLVPKLPSIRQWTNTYVEGGGAPELTVYMFSVLWVLGGAAVGVGAGAIAFASIVTKIQALYGLYLLTALGAAVVQIANGAIFLNLFNIIDETAFVGNPNDDDYSATELSYIDFNIAIFNTCCVERGWADTVAAVPCTGDNKPISQGGDCPDITNSEVENFINPELLCTCGSDNVPAMIEALGNYTDDGSHLCTAMESWDVVVSDNLKIPTTPVDLRFATSAQYGSYSYESVPVVGNHIPVDVAANKGFGCGLGYLKGIMWLSSEYVKQQIEPTAIMGIAMGAAQIFFLVIGFTIDKMQKCENREGEWANKEDVPAGFMVTTMDQQQQHRGADFAYGAGPASPQQQPAPVAVAAPASVASSGGDSSKIAAQLRAFYTQHDPGKDLNDVNDVAEWAAKRGVDALNEKLRNKYGVDLNSVSGSSTVKVAMGASMPDI